MQYDVKDMLEIAIQNNDSLWEVEVIDRLQDELERLYRQEAKAKALDRVKEFAVEPPFLLANNENEDYERYAYDQILKLINKYESGEQNAEK